MEQLNKLYIVVSYNGDELVEKLKASNEEIRLYSNLKEALEQEYILNTFNYNAVLFARESLHGNVITARELMLGTNNIPGLLKSNKNLHVYEVTLKNYKLEDNHKQVIVLPVFDNEFIIKYNIEDESTKEELKTNCFVVSLEEVMYNTDNCNYKIASINNIQDFKLIATSEKELKESQSDDFIGLYNLAINQEMQFILDGSEAI